MRIVRITEQEKNCVKFKNISQTATANSANKRYHTLGKNQWKVTGYPVIQAPLENSVVSHGKFIEISLETSETLLETSLTSLNDQCHATEIPSCTWVTGTY